MLHSFEYVFLDSSVISIQFLDKILYILPLGSIGSWTGVWKKRKLGFPGKPFQESLFYIGQRPDEVELSLEVSLVRNHGADFSREEDVEKEGFDYVVFIVGQGDLVAAVVPGHFKKDPPAQPRAEKAGTGFAVIIAVG